MREFYLKMIRVLIADDHPLVREGLKRILEAYPDIVVTGEAGSGQELLKKARENDYDVALLDISMPGRNGLDVLKQLKNIKPDLHILVLSIFPEELYGVRAIKAGASGYLTKKSSPEKLITAIKKVAKGEKYINHSLSEKLAFYIKTDAKKSLHENLSDREYQVMCMIASGKTVKEIAEELSLAVSTVSTHRAHILEKMNMKNNAELTYYAIKEGLIL